MIHLFPLSGRVCNIAIISSLNRWWNSWLKSTRPGVWEWGWSRGYGKLLKVSI